MQIIRDPLFLTGTALLAIAFGRTPMLVVGAIYTVLVLITILGVK